jgi:DNA-binding NtrC family response regulator
VELTKAVGNEIPGVSDQGLSPAAKPMRILMVDDDALVSFGASAMLEDLGHSVVDAFSGREALTLLEVHGDKESELTRLAKPYDQRALSEALAAATTRASLMRGTNR